MSNVCYYVGDRRHREASGGSPLASNCGRCEGERWSRSAALDELSSPLGGGSRSDIREKTVR